VSAGPLAERRLFVTLRALRVYTKYGDARLNPVLAVRSLPRIHDLSAQVRQFESRPTVATVRRPQQRKERCIRLDIQRSAVGRERSIRAEIEADEHDLAKIR
jgi:hypothetical protein